MRVGKNENRRTGPRPRRRKPIEWTADVAYSVGLIATDGCLINDGRHIELTSRDTEQLHNFKKCLGLNAKVTYKRSGYTNKRISRLQFGDVVLYKFLLLVGLDTAKTKTIGPLKIPRQFFFDFLRGHYDGDGSFYSYWDPRWKSSFMYYLTFISASRKHIVWLQNQIREFLGVEGTLNKVKSCYQLRYAKSESLKILKKMYHSDGIVCLFRKRLKIEKALGIVGERL